MVSAVQGAVVIIDVTAPVACQRCADGRGCGAGLLGADDGPRQVRLKAPQGMTLRAGDRVRLVIAPRQLLRAAWLAYGLPLSGLVLSVAIAVAVGVTDELTAGVVGLAGIVTATQFH